MTRLSSGTRSPQESCHSQLLHRILLVKFILFTMSDQGTIIPSELFSFGIRCSTLSLYGAWFPFREIFVVASIIYLIRNTRLTQPTGQQQLWKVLVSFIYEQWDTFISYAMTYVVFKTMDFYIACVQ